MQDSGNSNNGGWQDVPNAPQAPAQPAQPQYPPQQAYPPQPGYPPQPPAPQYPPQQQYAPPPPPPPQQYPPQQQQYGAPPPPPQFPPQQQYQQPGYPPPPSQFPPQQQSQGMSPTAAAAVSYLTFIPAVIFLFMEPYKRIPFVKFHSIQCIGLTLVWFAIDIVHSGIYYALPWGIYAAIGFVFWIVKLVLFVVWLIAIIKANKGEWFKVPVIGDFAMKQVR